MKQIHGDQKQERGSRVPLWVLGLAVGLGVAFQWFFYASVPGVAFPLFAVMFTVCSWVMAKKALIVVPRSAWPVAGALFVFSSLVAIRGGAFITFLNVCASVYLYALLLYMTLWRGWPRYVLRDYLAPITRLPFVVLRNMRQFLYELKPLHAASIKHPIVPRILVGIIVALPLLLIFILLFSSADLVFRKYVTDLFAFQINEDVFGRLVWIGAMSLLFCGVFGTLLLTQAKEVEPVALSDRPVYDVETKVVLGSLNVLFLVFIAIQLTYLFGGAHNITVEGFTYAQYARKGFFELIAAAVLTLVVTAGAARYVGRGFANRQRWFRLLAGGLMVQVLIIMVSAFRRLALYEGAYGFTTLRVYSHVFIIWLAIVFGLLLFRLFSARRASWFAAVVVSSVFVFLLGLNVMNVDAFVARKNIGRYYNTGKLDVGYLTQLSDDAVPEAAKALDSLPRDVQMRFADALYQKRVGIRDTERHWQSWNVARESALRAIDAHDGLIVETRLGGQNKN